MYKSSKVKEIKTLYKQYYQYRVLPSLWIPVTYSKGEIVHAAAAANGLDMGSAQKIEENIIEYANKETKNKIVGRLGKVACYKFYGFSPARVLSKKNRDFIDFIQDGINITVKANSYMRSETMLLDQRDIDNEGGPDIFVAVNVDFDLDNVYSTMAYIVGWIQKMTVRRIGRIAEDIKGEPLFVELDSLSAPGSLSGYIKMMGKK